MRVARRLVDRPERVLIFVERHLASITSDCPPGTRTTTSGRSRPPSPSVDADLGREVAMLGQAAALEHVAKLLLAPAAPRLGRIAQRIDELGGFGRDALVPVRIASIWPVSSPKASRRSASTFWTVVS